MLGILREEVSTWYPLLIFLQNWLCPLTENSVLKEGFLFLFLFCMGDRGSTSDCDSREWRERMDKEKSPDTKEQLTTEKS